MGIYRSLSSRHHLTLTLGALGAVLVLLSGCYDVAFSTCEEIPAEGLQSLRVESDRGPVEVIGVEGHELVELSGAIHVHASSEKGAESRAQNIDLQLYADGDEAVLTLRIPPEAGVAWGDLVVTVPAHLEGRVVTHDGRVRLSGLRADQAAATTNGALEVVDVVGDLTLDTTNGRIDLEQVEGDVWGETTNGEVELDGVHGELTLISTNGRMILREGSGSADLWTSSGGVEVEDFVGDVKAQTTNGRIDLVGVTGTGVAATTNGAVEALEHVGELDLSTTNGKIDMEVVIPEQGTVLAHTTNGPVDLIVPLDTAGSLLATTTNGSIDIEDLDFDGSLTPGEAIGTLGCGGTVEIVLSTTNGSIDVRGDEDLGGEVDETQGS